MAQRPRFGDDVCVSDAMANANLPWIIELFIADQARESSIMRDMIAKMQGRNARKPWSVKSAHSPAINKVPVRIGSVGTLRLALITVAIMMAVSTRAGLYGTYGFAQTSEPPTGLATGVSLSSSWTFPSVNVNHQGVGSPHDFVLEVKGWGQAFDASKYLEYEVRPAAGYALTLNQIVFNALRNNSPDAPTNMRIEIFVNDGAVLRTSSDFTLNTTWGTSTFSFADVTLSGTDHADVRFFGFGRPGSGDQPLQLDNVLTSGGIAAVPEPVNLSLAFLGGGFASIKLYRRIRKGLTAKRPATQFLPISDT